MQISTIGLDLAMHVFQVHGMDAEEKIVVRKQCGAARWWRSSRTYHRASSARGLRLSALLGAGA